MSLTVKVARARNVGRGMPGIGDPGLFGSLSGVVGRIAGIAKAIPGPIGWGAAAVQRIVAPQRQPISPSGIRLPDPTSEFGPQLPQVPKPGVAGVVQRLLPGGESGMIDAPPLGAPAGYHVNKTAYFLKDGTYVPAESRWVRNRRRNPLNPRAASRAISRIESLKRATSRFSRITIRKKCA